MIPAICQCEWPGAVEENQKKHISCGFAKIHQRLCPHFKHTVRSVSFHLVLGSQPSMISPITNQQASPWSHLIVRFVTADTLNMSTYKEDCVWQGNWAAYVFSVKWQEWRIDPETHTKIAISILDVQCWEELTPPRPLLIEPRLNFPLWSTRNARAPLNLSGWNNDVILTVNRLVPKCSVSDQFTAHISASHAVNIPLRSITEPARQRSYAKTHMKC